MAVSRDWFREDRNSEFQNIEMSFFHNMKVFFNNFVHNIKIIIMQNLNFCPVEMDIIYKHNTT